LVLVANGSEASLLVEASEELEKQGTSCQVVSIISEGLFREQDEAYQSSVLPFGVPTLGWTAGLPENLKSVVGPLGKVEGMTRFGASAPYTVLDEKFGFTPANVVSKAQNYLAEFKTLVEKISTIKV
jgi:transketolase